MFRYQAVTFRRGVHCQEPSRLSTSIRPPNHYRRLKVSWAMLLIAGATPIQRAEQLTSQGQPAWLLLGNSSLVADDGEFLGNVTCNQFESDGIFNRFGDYGSRFSSMSIWNRFGTYGGQFGTESPFNQFATPPFIQGIGLYLAEGRSFAPRVSPTELVNWCFEAGSADSEYWLGLIGD